MAEDLHFLERLTRIDRPQVDLALALYRDRPLLQYILAEARVPERAGRVALALVDPREGPFLVVTRDGDFVTCLGDGMRVGDMPIVARDQLAILSGRYDALRARLDRASAIAGDETAMARLGRILFRQRGVPTREDMQLVLDLEPLLFGDLLGLLIDCLELLTTRRARVLATLQVQRRRSGRHRGEALRSAAAWWDLLWGAGHLSVVVGEGARRRGGALPDALCADLLTLTREVTLEHQVAGPLVRDVWLAGRLGRLALPTVREHLAQPRGVLGYLEAALRLGAIGLRSSRMRAEATKALRGADDDALRSAGVGELVEGLRSYVHASLVDPEHARRVIVGEGRALCHARARRLAPDLTPWAVPADVPEHVALATMFNAGSHLRASDDAILVTSAAALGAARVQAAELYLPADVFPLLQPRSEPDEILPVLDFSTAPREPVRAPQRVGRNAPCPCGSGKKHKHCCG